MTSASARHSCAAAKLKLLRGVAANKGDHPMSNIPSSVMPHAQTKPADRPARRSVPRRLFRIAAAPAIVALGIGAMAFDRLRRDLTRGWSKARQ